MNGPPLAGALPLVAPETRADRLTALFEAHHERLYRLARRLSPSADDALDLVQETFLKAARSIDRIPARLRSEEAWLVRVLVNIQRDHWRKASVRKRFDTANQPIDPGKGPEAELVARATVW